MYTEFFFWWGELFFTYSFVLALRRVFCLHGTLDLDRIKRKSSFSSNQSVSIITAYWVGGVCSSGGGGGGGGGKRDPSAHPPPLC